MSCNNLYKYPAILLGLLAINLFSCKSEPRSDAMQLLKATEVIGLASPIQLEPSGKEILLEDYFLNTELIDSVIVPDYLEEKLSEDKKKLKLSITGEMPLLDVLTIYAEGINYDFLLKAPVKQAIKLELEDKGYRKVQVKGEMNAWNPQSANFTKEGNKWSYTFELNPGNYQYLFVVDGQDLQDPGNPKTASNGIGGFNSLLEVPQPDEDKLPKLSTRNHSGRDIYIRYENKPTQIIVLWNNYRLEVKNLDGPSYFKFEVPMTAQGIERSFVRAWAYNDEGISNDILIPLYQGRVLINPERLNRFDKEAQIMYFTLIDRFNNGNKENDEPVDDDRLTEKTNYQGGDIAGITQKIKDGYLKKMNINAIWLSPITQNPLRAYQEFPEPRRWYSGYHGYWPVESAKVDHRFGTEEELKELIKAAHENDINILLDFVCNHVHEDHPIYKNRPDWATTLDLPNGQKNIRIWDEQRLTTWFDTFLPTLDLENDEVVEVQSDSAMFWITEYGIDGYRHDATKHIPQKFWRKLTRKLKENVMVNRPLYQIGETYGSRELIQSYIGSGMLDAQFDFNLYFDAREVLARPETSFETLLASMKETFNYYGYHSSMGYISGNHDAPRFISLAGGDLKFGENDREAGFNRDIGVGDPVGYKRLQMMHAFNMAIPGVPVIFYGDEIGLPGAGDPDNRRMMKFEGLEGDEATTKENVEKLTELRRNRLSLTYGDTEILHVDEGSLVIFRNYFREGTLIAFNKTNEEKNITVEVSGRFANSELSTHFGNSITKEENMITLKLQPVSFEYITN